MVAHSFVSKRCNKCAIRSESASTERAGSCRRSALSLAKADNRLVYASDLMSWQVVEYHDVAALERRGEHMLDVGSEGVAIHGAVEQPGCGNAGQSQTGDERHRLPEIGRATCRERECQYV